MSDDDRAIEDAMASQEDEDVEDEVVSLLMEYGLSSEDAREASYRIAFIYSNIPN